MSIKNIKDFRTAILNTHPNAHNFQHPTICGSQRNVLFADLDDTTHVFKFNTPALIAKNEYVSKIYADYDIPCPKIVAMHHNNIHFEEYEKIPGQTLYEYSTGPNANPHIIKQVYQEILDNFVKMSKIPAHLLNNFPHKHMHTVAQEQITSTNNALLGKLCMSLVYLLNLGPQKNTAIYHSDITPKNVIISPDGHLRAFLDIDTVAVCNHNYAFSALSAKYLELGFDIEELFNYLEQINGPRINQSYVSKMAHGHNYCKKKLWLHQKHKSKTR